MLIDSRSWWTDDRLQATVTPDYLFKQFRPEIHDLLKLSIPSGNGSGGQTYIEYILERARRLYLILAHIGISEQIFTLIDESYNDHDLPIAAEQVRDLRLSDRPDQSLDRRFYKAQFKYLVRDIKEGDHVRFLDEETIPVKLATSASAVSKLTKDGLEKVHLASDETRIYARKRVVLHESPNHLTEADVLAEIASAKRLANQHVLSVFGSYLEKNHVYVLLTPAATYTLHSFLDSPPKHFENLPKPERREILLNWPHCLANGLAWLHSNRKNHGAIRPSNILIDNKYRISLGQVESLTITHSNVKFSDIEAYHFAAPERWKRAATMQTKAPPTTFHSGGRTARKATVTKRSSASSGNEGPDGWPPAPSTTSPIDMSKPTSTSYSFIPTTKRHGSRGQSKQADGKEYAPSIMSSNSSQTRQDRSNSALGQASYNRAAFSASVLSTRSSHSSSSGQNNGNKVPSSVILAPSEVRTAFVQTWQSAQYDLFAADVFSLGAIILEIITYLCKRSTGTFARHRSQRNRTAGRGGGVADASFHANLGQVYTWTVSLEEDAKKKASKEEGKIFNAVAPIIEVAQECLARNAEDRPEAVVVEGSLEHCLQLFTSSGMTHCSFRKPSQEKRPENRARSRSDLHRQPKKMAADLSSRDKELAGVGSSMSSPRGPSFKSEKSKSSSGTGRSAGRTFIPTHDSVAAFDFNYGQPATSHHNFHGDIRSNRDEHARYYPASSSGGDTIDLQSIADRPDRLQNVTDISSWSHTYSDPRASYVSTATQDTSILGPDLDDNFCAPGSPPKSPLPPPPTISIFPSPPTRSSARPPPPPNPHLKNPIHRPLASQFARRRQRAPTLDSTSEYESASDLDYTTVTSKSRSRNSLDSFTRQAGGGGHSTTSASEISRSRESVSTLASSSSTLRLSWKARPISPVSTQDNHRDSIATVSASESPSVSSPSEDEETSGNDGEDGYALYARARGHHHHHPQPDPVERVSQASKTWDLSTAEQMWESLHTPRQGSGSSGGGKGKQRERVLGDGAGGHTGGMKARIKARYSILGGGRM